MKTLTKALSIGLLIGASICFGNKSGPFPVQNRTVDQLFKMALVPATQETGLRSLEQIAEGHPENVDSQAAIAFGRKLQPVELAEFKDPGVRAHALYKIAETGLPEAVDYLGRLKPGDLGKDTTGQLDQAIGLSYRQALYLQKKDPQRRIEFLESALEERSIPSANGAIWHWAANQLCDGGQITSLPRIQKVIRYWIPGERGEDMIRFCENRMNIVRSGPDRVKMLSEALKITSDPHATDLICWAIRQLDAEHSPRADEVLDQFAAKIQALSLDSAEGLNLLVARHIILQRKEK